MISRFIAIFLFLNSSPLSAQKTVHLSGNSAVADSKTSYTYVDSTRNIGSPDFQEFQFIENKDLEVDYNPDIRFAYWRKILIVNQSQSPLWLLEFPDPHIGELKVFIKTKNGFFESKQVGFEFPFNNRPILHKNFSFELSIPPKDTATVYARFLSKNHCGISANIRTIPNYVQYFFAEYHVLGLYYGIILMLIVYNAFLAFYTKEKIYLYYCFYTISCALFTYTEDGLGFEWLWPSFPLMNYLLERCSPILLLVSFLFYSGNLIGLKRKYFNFQIAIFATSILYVSVHLFIQDEYHLNNVFYVFPFAITFYTALKIYQSGFRVARFFLIGNSIILVSFVVFFFRANGWIISNAFTVYLFNYGFVFEAIVFSIALSEKLKLINDQKDVAQKEIIHQLEINDNLQQKVNLELETKVEERTVELKKRTLELLDANQKLENLKKELYEMNSKMDVNIWELKKEVKKEMEARFLNDTISYEEFIEIYTDVKCYQYLKELKWKDGFVCPKCGNKKSGRGNTNFTFKCTQCQHQESVTSHTLFHGVKFPISKAFYIAYYIMKNGNDLTYEQLSSIVGLTKNTVWKFGRKVNSGLQSLNNKKNVNGSWEKLVLSTPEE
ncbi:MAG: transposase [Opitutaceae bacterium]|nr:transposase [Cytophagales bacterium]